MCSTHRLVRRGYSLSQLHLNDTDILHCDVGWVVLFFNRSAYVLLAHLPKPGVFPSVHADFGPYLSFDLNYATIWATAAELYYLILTPAVTVSYSGHMYIVNARGI